MQKIMNPQIRFLNPVENLYGMPLRVAFLQDVKIAYTYSHELRRIRLNLWLKKVFYIFFREGEGTNWEVVKDVGLSLIEAMMAFDKVGPLQGDLESNFENFVF